MRHWRELVLITGILTAVIAPRLPASDPIAGRTVPAERPPKRGPLMLIGGHECADPDVRILREFVRIAGGKQARLVAITAATAYPDKARKKYEAAFGKIGVSNLAVVHIRRPDEADTEANFQAIRKATGVFFTGGDQQLLADALGNTKLHRLLHRRYLEGMALGGTSAGSMAMSEVVVYGGDDDDGPRAGQVKLGDGLNFMPGLIIDSHFSERGRLGRLLSALAVRPDALAIGLDENTALVVTDRGRGKVIGEGVVTFIEVSRSTRNELHRRQKGEAFSFHDLTLSVLSDGSRFDLPTLTTSEEDNTRPTAEAGN